MLSSSSSEEERPGSAMSLLLIITALVIYVHGCDRFTTQLEPQPTSVISVSV